MNNFFTKNYYLILTLTIFVIIDKKMAISENAQQAQLVQQAQQYLLALNAQYAQQALMAQQDQETQQALLAQQAQQYLLVQKSQLDQKTQKALNTQRALKVEQAQKALQSQTAMSVEQKCINQIVFTFNKPTLCFILQYRLIFNVQTTGVGEFIYAYFNLTKKSINELGQTDYSVRYYKNLWTNFKHLHNNNTLDFLLTPDQWCTKYFSLTSCMQSLKQSGFQESIINNLEHGYNNLHVFDLLEDNHYKQVLNQNIIIAENSVTQTLIDTTSIRYYIYLIKCFLSTKGYDTDIVTPEQYCKNPDEHDTISESRNTGLSLRCSGQ